MSSEQLKTNIQLIKGATLPGENTALRVGSTLELLDAEKRDILDSFSKSETLDLINEVKALATSGAVFLGNIKPSTVIPTNGDVWAFAEAGTYPNTGGIVVPANNIGIVSRAKNVWTSTNIAIPNPTVIDGFTSTSTTSASSANNATVLMNYIKTGAVRDFVVGPYAAGEVVRYLGLLWKAKTAITSAVPGANANWELYIPYTKAPALLTSFATTLTIDLVANSVTLIGASSNKIVTATGVYNLTAQTITTPVNTYYVVIYNVGTNVARAQTATNNATIPLGVDDYILFYVLNLNSTSQDVFGAKGYRLINASGTTDYPIKPVAVTDVIYNHIFSTYQTARTEVEKFWLNKAIVDAEFYNVKDNTTVVLYGLGKNYGGTNLTYLGFIYAETSKPAVFLYADEFNNALSMTYDANLHSGVKTYYLRSGTSRLSNSTIYGKVTIDWSQVPNTQRVLEGNSGVVNNSNINRIHYLKSETFNNPLGFIKFSRSKSFGEYFSAPLIPSYSGTAGTGIPKSPYEDCRQWALQWDAFVSSPPAGYTVTKETITTDAPTDTDPSNKLPIYGYSFLPAKLGPGDPTAKNAQTLPRIFINCSIHGFEKTPSFLVYEFMKLLTTNYKYHSFLEYLRFNVEFVIIPFANPHGWNTGGGAGSRKNFNNVDLNRNFPVFWAGGGTPTDSTYPGPSALSEIESQAIYTWMQGKITPNTIMGIDFHNFHGVPETDPKLYNMAWVLNLGSELGQSAANVFIKEISIKYKDKAPTLIPQSDDYFVGNSNNYNGPGFSGSAMKSIGALYASTFEVCQNFRFNPTFKSFDSDAMTYGVESFVNYLRIFLAEHIAEYNRVK